MAASAAKKSTSTGAKPKQKKAPASRGRGRPRSDAQLERQFQAYNLNVNRGYTIRQIAQALNVGQATVHQDIKLEGERRANELGERRATEIARAVNFYENVIQRAMRRADWADKHYASESKPKFNCRALDVAVKARERIDKIIGLDAAQRVQLESSDGSPVEIVRVLVEKPADLAPV
jgi:IS30 family transposase